MNKEFLETYKDIPDAAFDSIKMAEANSVLVIYEGEYFLKNETKEISLNGKITYEWLANSGVYFYGNLVTDFDSGELCSAINDNSTYFVLVNGLEFGQGSITKLESSNSTQNKIKGAISQCAILGNKNVSVEKIKFSIPNLRDFYGLPVKRVTETKTNIRLSRDRLVFEDETYKIFIEKCSDFKKRKENLEEKGGYVILYNGELTAKKGILNHADTRDVFHCFSTFLTFLNGRRTSAFFIQGISGEEVIWTDYTNYFVDTFKVVHTWPQTNSTTNLEEIWRNFRAVWGKNPENKLFFKSLIHWYVEANSQAGFLEGAIILAQTALELAYNWWIVEDKKMILGKDSANISASNKIRLLISQLSISSSIPAEFTELEKFRRATDNVDDSPDSIVSIRNAIVHSQEAKRAKLSAIHHKAKYEALQVYIWYIELTLLCILEYNSKYFNRCLKKGYATDSEEQVPWKKCEH
ncbi:MAG: hypothetical protein EAZ70_05130 [Runella slithyformis]|nr:MAG: hypothetical protein EAY79_04790 [Runella slithyformis]TAE98956.1 MAG: hypothetical protein EAZ80_05735 [Runella slithyformis]TAF28493.1 MAG: hypothetical protein EAZ70_05130 [Runella slithyformis]TAF47172.1 MAG: hypothetical protein EAZ63_08130 [Runella slithyformis]